MTANFLSRCPPTSSTYACGRVVFAARGDEMKKWCVHKTTRTKPCALHIAPCAPHIRFSQRNTWEAGGEGSGAQHV